MMLTDGLLLVLLLAGDQCQLVFADSVLTPARCSHYSKPVIDYGCFHFHSHFYLLLTASLLSSETWHPIWWNDFISYWSATESSLKRCSTQAIV